MSGSATLTIVTSSSSMKVATQTATRVHHFRSTSGSLARVASSKRTIGCASFPPVCGSGCARTPPGRPSTSPLAAAGVHGPAAAAWLAARRATYAHSGHQLARMAMRRHATLARFGGAATGVGGFVTVVPDLAALAWIQSRMVFFIAAAYGYDPRDPMRPAELLVLARLYDDPVAARRGPRRARQPASPPRGSASSSAARRPSRGRLVSMVGRHTGRHVAGRLVPGLAIVVNAAANERGDPAPGPPRDRLLRGLARTAGTGAGRPVYPGCPTARREEGDMRMRWPMAAVAVLAGLALPAAAQAGGWATVGLDPVPGAARADQPQDVELTILQHGRTPLDGLAPAVRVSPRAAASVRIFRARPAGRPGVYTARVVFPRAGVWSYAVDDGFTARHAFGDVRVASAAAAADAAAEAGDDGDPWPWSPGALAAAAAAGLLAAFGVSRARRRRPAVGPG